MNLPSKTYIAVPAEIIGIILPLLLGVAFLVLAERKVMAFVQRRKGPDVVGSFGLLQPLADGSKLILKEPLSPSSANFSLFRMAPVATFMLSLVARAVVAFDYGMVLSDPNIGLLYLFAISSLGVYGMIIAGRSSNEGGGRSVAYDPRTSQSPRGLCRRCGTIYSTRVWADRSRALTAFRSGPGRSLVRAGIQKWKSFTAHLRSSLMIERNP